MHFQYNTIAYKLLVDQFYNKKTIFYKKCDLYYYCQLKSFAQLFELLTIELKVFNPKLLQKTDYFIPKDAMKKERNKIKIIKQCAKMGEQLIKENYDFFCKEESVINMSYKKNFHITQKALEPFIKMILTPLLKLVDRCEQYNWIKVPNKKGFWRELNNEHSICEIFNIRGKNMIRL
jgi:hypothetical protein